MAADRERSPTVAGQDSPRDPASRAAFTVELEPTADGRQRALLYPDEDTRPSSGHWLAAPAALLVDLTEVR